MSIKPLKDIEKKVNKGSYPQDWVAYNLAQTQEKLLFIELLHELTSQIPQPKYKGNGRPPANFGEMVFTCCLKTYLDFSSRRSESDIKLVKQLGYITHASHFNTILKYLNQPIMKKVLAKLIALSSLPLKEIEKDFTMDASGFSTAMVCNWNKSQKIHSEKRLFKKAHVMSGVKTNIITHVEITDGYVHDSLMLEKLVVSTNKHFRMEEVSADKGYSSEKNLQIIAKTGAVPYVLFKINAKKTKDRLPIWRTMLLFFRENKEEFMEHYHKRNNAESVFSMMKRKFGGFVRARKSLAQENEVLCKVLCHNICVLIQEMFELGIKIDFEEIVRDEFMCKFRLD